jgi:NADPH:quinone reductase-like Zn-dependent oxidoreductase
MQRRVYRLQAGDIRRMQLSEETLPEPGPGEVCVEVASIGLNFADVFAIWGLYSATPKEPFIPGLEYAGRVLRTGPGVDAWKPGDRVMGVTRFGAYATHLNIDQRYLLRLPDDWDYSTGAAYLVQVLTAYYGLTHLGNLRPGYNVLIHSAAGGVGIFANRIARKLGATTIGTVGSDKKVPFCLQEGYERVIVRDEHFRERLIEALDGRPLHLIMECIGGDILKIGYEQLAEQGRMVVYGSAHYARRSDKPNILRLLWKFFRRPMIDPQKMIEQNRGILGFNLIYLYEQAPLMHELLQELSELNLEPPHVGHRFDFEKLPEAVRFFQGGESMGKVVVEVSS